MGISKNTVKLIDEHLNNINELAKCLDITEKDFKEQLLTERTYFQKIKPYIEKDIEIPAILIVVLENKLKHYKKNNKYRYLLAKKIIDYNNSAIERINNIPF